MSLIVDLEKYPFSAEHQNAFRHAFADEHPEFQKHAFFWALNILGAVGGLQGQWIDDRNRRAVLMARSMLKHYSDEVLGKVG